MSCIEFYNYYSLYMQIFFMYIYILKKISKGEKVSVANSVLQINEMDR